MFDPPLACMPKWRNWQTRQVQGLVVASPCGFKSRLRHQKISVRVIIYLSEVYIIPVIKPSAGGIHAPKLSSFRNMQTGQRCSVPAGRYGNFINSVPKLVNYIRYNIAQYYIAHLTLTVAEKVPEIDCGHLHRVLQSTSRCLKPVRSI